MMVVVVAVIVVVVGAPAMAYKIPNKFLANVIGTTRSFYALLISQVFFFSANIFLCLKNYN